MYSLHSLSPTAYTCACVRELEALMLPSNALGKEWLVNSSVFYTGIPCIIGRQQEDKELSPKTEPGAFEPVVYLN